MKKPHAAARPPARVAAREATLPRSVEPANGGSANGGAVQPAGDALFRALVEQIPAIISIERPGDTDICTFISPQVESILGYSAADVVRQPGLLASHVHPDDRERVRLEGERTTRTGDPFRVEYRIQARDDRWVWLRNEAVLIHDENGQPLHWLGVTLDITSQREAEAALRESEERFRTLFEGAGIATALVDARGVIQLANPALGALLGYDVGELVGMTNEAITHPDDNDAQQDLRRRMWEGGLDSYQLEKRYLRRDGSPLWAELHTTAIRNAAGEVVAALGQIQDITDRKTAETALRESEELFRAVFDHAPIGFTIVSPDGRFQQVNPALCTMLGYTEEELLGKTFQDITHPDDLADDLDQAERLWAGEIASYEMEKRYLHKDGHAVWIHVTASAVHDADGPRYGIAQIQDVTGRRHLEMERAIMLASEREYTRQLRELAGMRTDLSAMVAHELNTPVAAVKMMTTMLATKELSPQEEATTFAAIYGQIDQLDRLVADFAAAAAAERDDFSVQLHPVPLAVLLAGAAAFAQTTLSGHPFSVDPAGAVRVWCDPERIGQVLHNLLENAAKHTPPGTPIALRVRRTGEWIRVEVRDEGPGIPAEDLRLIFEKFGRARETAARETPGAGLGLYVSRGIVEAHGSELTAISTPGHGTVFTFELKVAL